MADFPDSTIDRKTLLPQLFPNPENYLLLAGLAGTAKDSAAWTQEADNLITLGGAMGAAVSMGLGMALAAPDRQIAVLTGEDGGGCRHTIRHDDLVARRNTRNCEIPDRHPGPEIPVRARHARRADGL